MSSRDRVVADALARGVDFLKRKQRPDGSFAVYYSHDHTLQRGCTDDRTPFCAAMVANCLGYVDGEAARDCVDRTISFFLHEMRSGVWRYFIRAHPYYKNVPPDVDDTSCISKVLQANNVVFPNNHKTLLLNRDSHGMFYTWIRPRLRWTCHCQYWRVIVPQILKPIRSLMYWRVFNARPDDVDGLINANVLWYIGGTTPDHPIVENLCRALRDGKEELCDKWYSNRFVFYYKASRTLEPVFDELGSVRATMIDKIEAATRLDTNALDLALSICASLTCNVAASALHGSVKRLIDAQGDDGGWTAYPMYYDGLPKVGAFGSEELTTAFCLEALARYMKLTAI